jgi:hypothetical protein
MLQNFPSWFSSSRPQRLSHVDSPVTVTMACGVRINDIIARFP